MTSQQTHEGVSSLCGDIHESTYRRRLEGKVAIVTGGSRGIGEATVRLFVKHGASVVIGDVDDAAGKSVAASLAPAATFFHCDVRREDDIRHLIDSTVQQHGHLDILFNNAGILGDQSEDRKSIQNLDAEEFDRVMQVNARGVALGMKHAARVMVPRRRGCIVSTASVAGVRGGLGPHAYSASKHAIVGLTKNAACELGKFGVKVNCISPFGVATAMLVKAWKEPGEESGSSNAVPTEAEVEKIEVFVRNLGDLKGSTLRATDIAEAALFLASDDSNYVSGHNLVVDGGVTTNRNIVGL
ncbi:hypothetical protein H6P81_008063 [Aristolochia fimbriata]|uniref:Uncharacterized protein n=1 Tax=Aristolochia fimbriata TaxID=158543 RepID=A0AAV7F2M7_ARIFI|nr:hypothetical protein H6P81_008063 [Aristolochia fimbriata]